MRDRLEFANRLVADASRRHTTPSTSLLGRGAFITVRQTTSPFVTSLVRNMTSLYRPTRQRLQLGTGPSRPPAHGQLSPKTEQDDNERNRRSGDVTRVPRDGHLFIDFCIAPQLRVYVDDHLYMEGHRGNCS